MGTKKAAVLVRAAEIAESKKIVKQARDLYPSLPGDGFRLMAALRDGLITSAEQRVAQEWVAAQPLA
jgi:hypothetical protein